ncbi:MAG: hypothetical protein Q7S23_01250 [bacterium]|nr:hypothetical protein [bacterium]
MRYRRWMFFPWQTWGMVAAIFFAAGIAWWSLKGIPDYDPSRPWQFARLVASGEYAWQEEGDLLVFHGAVPAIRQAALDSPAPAVQLELRKLLIALDPDDDTPRIFQDGSVPHVLKSLPWGFNHWLIHNGHLCARQGTVRDVVMELMELPEHEALAAWRDYVVLTVMTELLYDQRSRFGQFSFSPQDVAHTTAELLRDVYRPLRAAAKIEGRVWRLPSILGPLTELEQKLAELGDHSETLEWYQLFQF